MSGFQCFKVAFMYWLAYMRGKLPARIFWYELNTKCYVYNRLFLRK